MEKYLDVLRNCPLFKGIADENLLRMLNCLGARVEFFDKKYTVIAEGNPAKFIGIVLSGAVQVINTDFYGNRSIVAVSEKGEMFSEAFACAETESIPVSVVATEPSEIMLINCSHILHTCTNNCGFHQQMIFNLMKSLAVKNIQFHQKIEVTSKRSTREKLLSYLTICEKKAGAPSFDIPFDRQELADFLGVERSGLSAEISKLKKEGIIDAYKKHFELL
ncbi:MAG: Crp/Fnr family transcriptional regulator [Clostridia bacterium]|nr:Crp/Fnr family transcriptional regulator [Clostridia bacterium]